jgi:hypothetical protein
MLAAGACLGRRTTCEPTWRPAMVYVATMFTVCERCEGGCEVGLVMSLDCLLAATTFRLVVARQ